MKNNTPQTNTSNSAHPLPDEIEAYFQNISAAEILRFTCSISLCEDTKKKRYKAVKSLSHLLNLLE